MTENEALAVVFEKYNKLLCTQADKYEFEKAELSEKQQKKIARLLKKPDKVKASAPLRFTSFVALAAGVVLVISLSLPGSRQYLKTLFSDPSSDIQTADPDDISGLEKRVVFGNFAFSPRNVDELEEFSEYIVVATAQEGFLEAEQVWNNMYDTEQADINDADLGMSYTKRRFKVDKIYKGINTDLQEFVLREDMITDGKVVKSFGGEFPVKKGNKYLIFMYRARGSETEFYTFIGDGKYNLNGTQTENVLPKLLEEVRERYKQDFES